MADISANAAVGAPQAEDHQQHPIGLYFSAWALLFVLSALSYLVDYAALEGLLRWSLILIFMTLKAGLIVAVFMHMAWERLALGYAILLPPLFVVVFMAMMSMEAGYTETTRGTYFVTDPVTAD